MLGSLRLRFALVLRGPSHSYPPGTACGGRTVRAESGKVDVWQCLILAVHSLQHEVVGDIANAIWQIKERVVKQDHWNFDYYLEVRLYFLNPSLTLHREPFLGFQRTKNSS